MRTFDELESNVRSYIRSFPTTFDKAKGAFLYDDQGKKFIDFFAGAGTLNYGHNNPKISEALIKYLQEDGIVHGLDKATVAKEKFITAMNDIILQPRNMHYKFQFPGPTGTNAVETALKLARMVKGRSNLIAFTNGYHGLTMGSVAVTGNSFYRDEAFIDRNNVSFLPYCGFLKSEACPDKCQKECYCSVHNVRRMLEDPSSGVDLPAAMILETIQGEGGVNVATVEWLREMEKICREFDILMIVDDIQVGNGRTGNFFSFEDAGIYPDMITLSKSLGGGLPLSLLLLKPELDQWKPGEHTGTFRGNNLAFIAAVEGLSYWENDALSRAVEERSEIIRKHLMGFKEKYSQLPIEVRGKGMIFGMQIHEPGTVSQISTKAFEKGLLIETAGGNGDVLKFLPPLIIEKETLEEGFQIIDEAIAEVLEEQSLSVEGTV